MAHKQSPKSSFWRIFFEGAILLGLVSMPHQECPETVRFSEEFYISVVFTVLISLKYMMIKYT